MMLGGAGESLFGIGYAADNDSVDLPKQKKTRTQRYVYARRDTEDGPLEIIPPQESLWYRFYVRNFYIHEDVKLQKAFRLRFRLPYKQYLELVQQVQSNELFDRWCGSKSNNKKVSPVELLVLGTLRYLGRGWTFDDIEESTAIDKDVHRRFLQVFIRFGSTVLYNKWVITPVDVPEAKSNMHEYSQAGFPGCVGSSDCTHIVTERCQYNLKNNHLGAKSSLTTRTFNLTCDHRRRILHTTNGGPGRWNDQSMVRLDTFVSGIRDGSVLDDCDFELLAHGKDGEVRSLRFRGAYLIVDNGYLNWSCTVPPFGVTNNIDEIRWSKWLESMRKDVECTFGILKGRWRILKSGVRIYGVDSVDHIWFTCCALHNWLLEIDGLTQKWVCGVKMLTSEWDGEMGCLEYEGVRVDVPNALARLSTNLDPRNYDSTGLGPGLDVVDETRTLMNRDFGEREEDISREIEIGGDRVRHVRHLSLAVFRRLLVNHFSILFSQNKLVWPRRSNKTPQRRLLLTSN